MIQSLASAGIKKSISGLSDMIGEELSFTAPEINFVPILQIPSLVGGPENEAVGVYLRAEGEMAGQFMLIMPLKKALEMVDMLMDDPIGTNQELEGMGRSALAEVGNLTGAFFLNGIAQITGKETVVTPPAVMLDMVSAILTIIVAHAGEKVERVITIRTNIITAHKQDIQADFWYVPDLSTVNALNNMRTQ
ncbi:MAG TPA: chemotaxis protein CheC [Anaerolineaceae bacterium]|nr:chemotaxis protein CheC [Anaerolineaceae bacterium]HPN51128.1 chemotaxis protein CheC [Anaerolineaceae bacterium]